MFLPLPFGMDTSKTLDYFNIEVRRFLLSISADKRDHLNEPDDKALKTRLTQIKLFIERAHEAGKQLESELPKKLPRSIRGFMAFGAIMRALDCWIELSSVERETIDGGQRAVYNVEVRLRDEGGLFSPAPRNGFGGGIPFLAGEGSPTEADRELGGFFSAYVMAASQLIDSAFLLGEGAHRREDA